MGLAELIALMQELYLRAEAQLAHVDPLTRSRAAWEAVAAGLDDTAALLRQKSGEIEPMWPDDAGRLYAERLARSSVTVQGWQQTLTAADLPTVVTDLATAVRTTVDAVREQRDLFNAAIARLAALDGAAAGAAVQAESLVAELAGIVAVTDGLLQDLDGRFAAAAGTVTGAADGTAWDGPAGGGVGAGATGGAADGAAAGAGAGGTSPPAGAAGPGGPAAPLTASPLDAAGAPSPLDGTGARSAPGGAGSPPPIEPVGVPAPIGLAGSPPPIGPIGVPAPIGLAGSPPPIGPIGVPAPIGLSGSPSPIGPVGSIPPLGPVSGGGAHRPPVGAAGLGIRPPVGAAGLGVRPPGGSGVGGAIPRAGRAVAGAPLSAAPTAASGAGVHTGGSGAGSRPGRVFPPLLGGAAHGLGGRSGSGEPKPGDQESAYRDRPLQSLPGVPPALRGRTGALDATPGFLTGDRAADPPAESEGVLDEELWHADRPAPLFGPRRR